MTTPDPAWSDLCGSLPDHATEVMSAHRGTPGTGVPAPEPDNGQSDQQKYGGQGNAI